MAVDQSSRLNMTVYIESLCKFSKEFVQNQLRPIYDEIKEQINIKFVSFALMEDSLREDDTIKFKCLHGPRECEIDLFQTCSLHVYRQNQTKQAEIIFCTMKFHHNYTLCIDELQLNLPEIEKCTNGTLGLYLALNSQREASIVVGALGGVPAVIFNNIIDPVVAEYSLKDLSAVVKRRMYLYYSQFNSSGDMFIE
ncbi:GILT-like protein 2 [Chironomus tepperi]|uniref:GILT-like protein 2 n=1 Tax=Chironomus tepperi TaxID=113505 RepID=UPI00391F39DC